MHKCFIKTSGPFALSHFVFVRRYYHIKLFNRAFKITLHVGRLFTDDRTARGNNDEIALFDLILGFKRAIRLADQTLGAVSLDRSADLFRYSDTYTVSLLLFGIRPPQAFCGIVGQ